jgi:cyclase
MPLCYGGGIKTIEQAQRIFSLGVEKIAISSAAIQNPSLVSELATKVGSQSVVVVIDVKKKIFGGYDIYIENGRKKYNLNLVDFAKKMEDEGAGEIVINSIDNDGMMKGYDLDLIDKVRNSISLPLTVIGGAGNLEDIGILINKYGIIGAAAGSLFVFKGKYKAVLISYPNWEEKDRLINHYLKIN